MWQVQVGGNQLFPLHEQALQGRATLAQGTDQKSLLLGAKHFVPVFDK